MQPSDTEVEPRRRVMNGDRVGAMNQERGWYGDQASAYGYRRGPDTVYAHPNASHEQIIVASGGNLIAGLWLIAAPFVLTYVSSTARGNDILLGIAIASIAAIRVFGAYRAAWLSWINVLLGVWLIIAPWVLGYSGLAQPTWNDVIVGIITAVLGTWSAMASHGTFTGAMRGHNAGTR